MKQSKVLGIVLAIVNVIVIIVCVLMYMRMDRTEPKLEFHTVNIVYRQDMDITEFLTGVTAYDSVDGDITDRIVIEKITENPEEGSAVVFYAVSDKAGNVIKASRFFEAEFEEEISRTDKSDKADESSGQADGDMPEPMTLPSEMPTPSDAAIPTLTPTPNPTMTPMPTRTPEPTRTPAPTRAPAPTPEPEPESAPTPTPTSLTAPILTLKTSQVTVGIGMGPAWVDVIETLSDDEDSYDTLFRNLNVSKYDMDRAGTYQVTVYTEDSDGNKSQPQPLTIIVQ